MNLLGSFRRRCICCAQPVCTYQRSNVCMSFLRMRACLYHHACVHEARRRPMCCCLLAQLTCRYMAFMPEFSQNVCLPVSSHLFARVESACQCLAAGVMACVCQHSCLCIHERCCARAKLVCRNISVLACMHEARGKV
jgi:hypothetical protein